MKFIIGNKKFESDKINLIAVDGRTTLLGWAEGIGRCWVTMKGDNGAEYNFPSGCYIDKAKAQIKVINKALKAQNMHNFLYVNGVIINLDKVASYNSQYTLGGIEFVSAEFKDGSEYSLYRGFDKNYAKRLYQVLGKIQNTYAEDKKAEKSRLSSSR